jgi:hypothetical protein
MFTLSFVGHIFLAAPTKYHASVDSRHGEVQVLRLREVELGERIKW